jgi:hypothetical protein
MKLESPVFKNSESIPSKYTCDGDNVNPPLKISAMPDEAKSLVLIVDDPDAPRGTWVHWLVWNIQPDTKEVNENTVPKGAVEGMTSFGKAGYGGPCPPSGIHRYFFKIYAIDKILDISAKSKMADLEQAINGHVLSSAELMGRYEKL